MTQSSNQRRRGLTLILLAAFTTCQSNFALRAQPPAGAGIDGFTSADSLLERRWEEQFRALPSAASAREELRRLTLEPHVAGTPEDYATAIYVHDRMVDAGLSAEIKEYQVLLSYPKRSGLVEIVTPGRAALKLREAIVPEDPSSSDPRIIPLFNGYSASGDVTGPLVYVNYGLPEDYAALKKLGVNVRGSIAIARYGNSFRGVKAKVAEENGILGLIIYSDPAEDGYAQGDVYPKGPWRPETSAQRGSVEYIFDYPGDPLTPGRPSIPGTPRLALTEATNLPHIPVQPISYGDARRLLEPLGGALRPRGFQGGLPFAYHVGGTNRLQVHLRTELEYATRTIWNVVARLDGAAENDHWVILGNHRDAWTFGAVDPNSGTAAMLEVARGLGRLVKAGWKPRRRIVLCSWDAEEYGLVGSTEWVEELAPELRQKAVAYLNVDAAVSGPNFSASAVPSLWRLIRESARDVKDPKTGKTIYQAWQDRARDTQRDLEMVNPGAGPEPKTAEARIGALGSGSDYTPFLQHLGVASLDMTFSGSYGVYHSAFDSFHWMSKFGDPTFEYHVAAAQLWGTLAMRLADAAVLPFNYLDYASQIREFVSATASSAARRNLAGSFDSGALSQAVDGLAREAALAERRRMEVIGEIEEARAMGRTEDARLTGRQSKINEALIETERALIDERGLHGRAWYKHQIYAPGFYTGYAAQPLPDLQQAIDEGDGPRARDAAVRIVEALRRATEALKRSHE